MNAAHLSRALCVGWNPQTEPTSLRKSLRQDFLVCCNMPPMACLLRPRPESVIHSCRQCYDVPSDITPCFLAVVRMEKPVPHLPTWRTQRSPHRRRARPPKTMRRIPLHPIQFPKRLSDSPRRIIKDWQPELKEQNPQIKVRPRRKRIPRPKLLLKLAPHPHR